jgi:predicted dehydrogenase
VSGAISQQGRPFGHGFEIYLERATLSFGFAGLSDSPQVNALAVILPDGSVERPELGSGDPIEAFTRELAVAVDAVATRVQPDRLSGVMARDALEVCRAEIESVKTGEAVLIS